MSTLSKKTRQGNRKTSKPSQTSPHAVQPVEAPSVPVGTLPVNCFAAPYFEPNTSKSFLSSLQEGKIYFLYLDGQPMIKRLRWAEPNRLMALISDNKTCDDMVCSVERVRLGGLALKAWIDLVKVT